MNALRNRTARPGAQRHPDDPCPPPTTGRPGSTKTRLVRLGWSLVLWLCLFAFGASAEPAGDAGDEQLAEAAADRHACLRCHAMSSLAYRDPETSEIIDLSIDRDGLAHSVHGELACIDCHRRSYRRYPHPDRPAPGDMDCIGCHEGDDQNLSRGWVDIDAEFKRSVHAVSDSPKAAGFSCHSVPRLRIASARRRSESRSRRSCGTTTGSACLAIRGWSRPPAQAMTGCRTATPIGHRYAASTVTRPSRTLRIMRFCRRRKAKRIASAVTPPTRSSLRASIISNRKKTSPAAVCSPRPSSTRPMWSE